MTYAPNNTKTVQNNVTQPGDSSSPPGGSN